MEAVFSCPNQAGREEIDYQLAGKTFEIEGLHIVFDLYCH